jgi:hypothetical protein
MTRILLTGSELLSAEFFELFDFDGDLFAVSLMTCSCAAAFAFWNARPLRASLGPTSVIATTTINLACQSLQQASLLPIPVGFLRGSFQEIHNLGLPLCRLRSRERGF